MLRRLFSPDNELAAGRLEAAESSRPKRSALIVDDDKDIPPLVERALADYHFETEGVNEGGLAVVRLRARVYDLVILDLGMAEMDGFEVLQALKRGRTLRDIPVLVLTSDTSEEALARSFGYGADDFVTKPFKLNELGMRAYRLVQPHRSFEFFRNSRY